MRLRSEGASLPQEWVTYLQRERREILDKIYQKERGPHSESSSSPDQIIQEAYSNGTPAIHPPSTLRPVTPTPVQHTDIQLHSGKNIPPSNRSIRK
jgi:hypothetical protein